MHFHSYYYNKILKHHYSWIDRKKLGLIGGTFYLHYVDKYDMFEQMKTN